MTFLIGGFRLTNFGDFRLTVFGQFNPTLTMVYFACYSGIDTLNWTRVQIINYWFVSVWSNYCILVVGWFLSED